jgi:hypothetical protein
MSHVLLQDFVPYDESVLWRLHDAYFASRGIAAWKEGDIPSLSTHNYPMACQHAQFLIKAWRHDETSCLTILEVGAGDGSFAISLLRALEQEGFKNPIQYILTDYSEANLREAALRPELAFRIQNREVITAVYDLSQPNPLSQLDGTPITSAIHAVFSNYVCCVVPTKHVRKRKTGWQELHVRAATEQRSAANKGVSWLESEALSPELIQGLKLDYAGINPDLSHHVPGFSSNASGHDAPRGSHRGQRFR